MKLKWDTLKKTVIKKEFLNRDILEELPEGQYRCPSCDGTGRRYIYEHGCPGIVHNPHKKLYERCWICMGQGMIKKCKTCDEAILIDMERCNDCIFKEIIEKSKRGEMI